MNEELHDNKLSHIGLSGDTTPQPDEPWESQWKDKYGNQLSRELLDAFVSQYGSREAAEAPLRKFLNHTDTPRHRLL